MDCLVTVRTQLWVKAIMLLGMPLLGWAGAYTIWLSVDARFSPFVENAFLFGAGVFCLVAVLKGIPLLRFLQHRLTLHVEGIEISKGRVSKFLSWDQVSTIKASDTFNILRVYDQSGRLVYAVDYYAENFREFAGLLNELLGRKP